MPSLHDRTRPPLLADDQLRVAAQANRQQRNERDLKLKVVPDPHRHGAVGLIVGRPGRRDCQLAGINSGGLRNDESAHVTGGCRGWAGRAAHGGIASRVARPVADEVIRGNRHRKVGDRESQKEYSRNGNREFGGSLSCGLRAVGTSFPRF